MISLGVTATRQGMAPRQYLRCFSICHNLQSLITEAHHGDCVGGDAQFHFFFKTLGFRTIIHPPKDDRYRAYCLGAWRVEEPDEYLKRDRAIVRASTLIISAPLSPTPRPRSGTWYTDRYARKARKDVIRVLPSGEVVPLRKTMRPESPYLERLEEYLDAT